LPPRIPASLIGHSKTYQQQQLEGTKERALPFLRAIATNQTIRYALLGAGYSDAEQAEGWKLLLAATGYSQPKATADADAAARQAITELDDWDEAGFRRIHAALERHHPEQDAFVFAGLEPSRGSAAVLGVSKLLDRLDQLEKGTEAERAAVATLTKRGITPEVRAHLRSLLVLAQPVGPINAPPAPDTSSEAQQRTLETLSAWYKDWSETARAVIRRRDHLILLGLAKRKSRKEETSRDDAEPESALGLPSAVTNRGVTTPAAE
jgi:hypothetical protein